MKVDNKAGKYKAGTPVHVSIAGRTVPKAVKVPLDSILTAEDGTKSVMIVNPDGTTHKVTIQVGINDGKNVQVTQGLNGSETVVTKGAYGLSDGTRVTVGKQNVGGEDN